MIDFGNEIIDDIKYLNSNSLLNKNSELEIRIGTFNKFGFSPGVSEECYNKILNLKIFNKVEYENTICFLSNNNFNNLREIWYFDKDKKKIIENGKIKKITIQKEKIKTIDIKNYNLRISLSNENIVKNSLNCKSNFARYKIRTSKYTKDNEWRYDFTEVYEIRIREKKDIKNWSELSMPSRYEIEIEYVKDNYNNIENNILNNLNYVINIIENNITITRDDLISDIYNNLNNIKKNGYKNMGFREITNQPKTLEIQYISHIKENYYVTEKNDGDRCLVYFLKNNNTVYLIDHKLIFNTIGKYKNNFSYLLDGEYLKKENKIIIFDILIFDNEDITDKYLDDRIMCINKLLENLDQTNLEVKLEQKKFLYEDNIFNSCKTIIESNSNLTDGLIFIPKNKKYYNKTYKWKPEHLNTIDFLVKHHKDDEYHLYVGISKKVANLYNIKKSYNFNTIFNNLKNIQTNYYFPTTFSLPTNEKLYIVNSEHELLKDNVILEFKYTNNEWVPIKHRKDKQDAFKKGKSYGNDWNVAVNNFNSIKNPVTKEMIMGNEPIPVPNIHFYQKQNKESTINMRRFHSEIKGRLYNKYIKKSDNILDLAGGKGQDIKKFLNLEPKNCVIIDYDKNAIFDSSDSAINRYKNILKTNPNKNSIFKFLLGDISKNITKTIDSTELNISKFDVITCNFAIQFLMKNNITFSGFIKNIEKYLKKDGILILLYFNGENVFNLLQSNNEIKYLNTEGDSIFKITKLYESKGKILKYGQKISVDINSIGCHEEYLVNYNNLVDKLKKCNINLIETKPFSKIYTEIELSNYEKSFSYLNNYSIFKKY